MRDSCALLRPSWSSAFGIALSPASKCGSRKRCRSSLAPASNRSACLVKTLLSSAFSFAVTPFPSLAASMSLATSAQLKAPAVAMVFARFEILFGIVCTSPDRYAA